VQKIIKNDSGIYLLEIFANSNFRIKIKKYINDRFYKGYYYYVGSAQKNLISRINRHLNKNKKINWHFDYITKLNSIEIKRVILFTNLKKEFECILSEKIFNIIKNDNKVIPDFGNSDCNKCRTHLYYSKNRIKLKDLMNFPNYNPNIILTICL